jgi:hypothetical protein
MATKVIKAERVSEVIELLTEGRTYNEIQLHLQAKYNTTRRTHDADIEQAYNEIKEQYEKKNGNTISRHFNTYNHIISGALEDKQFDVALKAMAQLEKLLKLHNPETALQINNNNLDLSHLSVEDLQKIISGNT